MLTGRLFEAQLYCWICDPSLRETRVISVKLVTSSRGCWFESIPSGKWSGVLGTIKLSPSICTGVSTDKRPHFVYAVRMPPFRASDTDPHPQVKIQTAVAARGTTESPGSLGIRDHTMLLGKSQLSQPPWVPLQTGGGGKAWAPTASWSLYLQAGR